LSCDIRIGPFGGVATLTSASCARSIYGEHGGEWLQARPGERCLIRVSAAETNDAYSIVEIVSGPLRSSTALNYRALKP
jgi:hypothetical protein